MFFCKFVNPLITFFFRDEPKKDKSENQFNLIWKFFKQLLRESQRDSVDPQVRKTLISEMDCSKYKLIKWNQVWICSLELFCLPLQRMTNLCDEKNAPSKSETIADHVGSLFRRRKKSVRPVEYNSSLCVWKSVSKRGGRLHLGLQAYCYDAISLLLTVHHSALLFHVKGWQIMDPWYWKIGPFDKKKTSSFPQIITIWIRNENNVESPRSCKKQTKGTLHPQLKWNFVKFSICFLHLSPPPLTLLCLTTLPTYFTQVSTLILLTFCLSRTHLLYAPKFYYFFTCSKLITF